MKLILSLALLAACATRPKSKIPTHMNMRHGKWQLVATIELKDKTAKVMKQPDFVCFNAESVHVIKDTTTFIGNRGCKTEVLEDSAHAFEMRYSCGNDVAGGDSRWEWDNEKFLTWNFTRKRNKEMTARGEQKFTFVSPDCGDLKPYL